MVETDVVWNRILAHEGQAFTQIRGQQFKYRVEGNGFIPSTTNRKIGRSEVEKALSFVPLTDTKLIQHLQGPSYLYAILMDGRIRASNW